MKKYSDVVNGRSGKIKGLKSHEDIPAVRIKNRTQKYLRLQLRLERRSGRFLLSDPSFTAGYDVGNFVLEIFSLPVILPIGLKTDADMKKPRQTGLKRKNLFLPSIHHSSFIIAFRFAHFVDGELGSIAIHGFHPRLLNLSPFRALVLPLHSSFIIHHSSLLFLLHPRLLSAAEAPLMWMDPHFVD